MNQSPKIWTKLENEAGCFEFDAWDVKTIHRCLVFTACGHQEYSFTITFRDGETWTFAHDDCDTYKQQLGKLSKAMALTQSLETLERLA